MLLPFLDRQAPNGRSWADYCGSVTPTLDHQGFVSGPWGELMHDAVKFERTQNWQSMPAYREEGPGGQAIQFLHQRGFAHFEGQIAKNEEATNQKMNREGVNCGFVFMGGGMPAAAPVGLVQGVVQGQVLPHHPGAPGSGTPVVVGIPLTQRVDSAIGSGSMPEGYSEGACRSGAAILDENPMMPENRPYRDLPWAVCFLFVVVLATALMGAFIKEIPLLIERIGTQWESTDGYRCNLSEELTKWPNGDLTQVAGISQRLVEPVETTTASPSASGGKRRLWETVESGGFDRLLLDSVSEVPELTLPGLSPFVRRLELLGLSDPFDVEYDLDEEDDGLDAAEDGAGAPARQLMSSSRRRSSSAREKTSPPDRDCERACAAFTECGGFEVSRGGSGAISCTFYKAQNPTPDPVQASGGSMKISCWQKVDAELLSKTAQSIMISLFGITLLAAFVSMFVAMGFVKFSSVQPKAATYVGVYCVPGCMIVIGVLVVGVLFPFVGAIALLVGGVLVCCGSCCMVCMCWCYRDLIPLTIEVVDAVSNIIARHWSMFCISLCGTLAGIVWSFICTSACLGIYAYTDRQSVTVPAAAQQPASKIVAYPQYFVESLVYLWGAYVVFNVCHTAYCGVFGRWYFGKEESVSGSLKVACTTAFGAICMGSFIIAVVRAIEKLAEKIRRDAEEEGNIATQVIACVLQCIIGCIGDILEWISSYVYVQVAIRGLGFCDGAKATYALATVSNLIYVVSAMLIDSVTFLGATLCALCGAAVAGLVGYATCGVPGFCMGLALICGVFGCLGGCMAGGTAVGIMNSGAVSVMMCWAERPDILAKTNEEIARRFQAGVDRAGGRSE
mmetsp:Transcript_139271/g.445212  ORF Transcript_139271/g.445212 Transcript_139271/m.445212 type:complete len:846 (+) Transcript_139271:174-2711(+)